MSIEAWKDTGDCSECRRRKYCKNQCSKAKLREQAAARSIVKSFTRAMKYRQRMDDVNSMKEELRVTERAVIGECSEQKVETIFDQCRKLAIHSTFTVRGVVSVLCSECRERGQSLSIVIKDMEDLLAQHAAKGL